MFTQLVLTFERTPVNSLLEFSLESEEALYEPLSIRENREYENASLKF